MYVYNTYVKWTSVCQTHSPPWAGGIPAHALCSGVIRKRVEQVRFETPPQQPRAESFRQADDGWTLQLWFHFVCRFAGRSSLCSLSPTFPSGVLALIFCSLHFLSFYLLSPLCFRVRRRQCDYVHWAVLAGNTRAYFGQNQLTQESFYSRSSYKL